MSYTGGTVLPMAGDDSVCIASDLLLGEQMNTLAVDQKKATPVPPPTRPLESSVGVSTIGQKNALANAAKISNNNEDSVEDPSPTPVPPTSSLHLDKSKPSKRPDLDSDDLVSGEEEELSTNKYSFATKAFKGYVDSDDLTESEEEEAYDVDGAIIDPGKLNEDGRKLYEQYQKRKEHVEKYEAEANKPPCLKGFTPRQYIKAQQATINYTRNRISMGLNEETEDSRNLIQQCTANIACVENKLAMGELMESELIEIHRTANDDALAKNLLRQHVEKQTTILREEKEKLLEMQKMQISESRY